MKRTMKIALLAITSALLVCAVSCSEPEETTPASICSFAKQVKDSTINAGTQANL